MSIIVNFLQGLRKSQSTNLFVCLSFMMSEWVSPENIHTIPQSASWNSQGFGGGGVGWCVLGLEF